MQTKDSLDLICREFDQYKENLVLISRERRDLVGDKLRQEFFRKSRYAERVNLLAGFLGELTFDYCLRRVLENCDVDVEPDILHKSIGKDGISVVKKGKYTFEATASLNRIEIRSRDYTIDIDCLVEVDGLPIIFEVKTAMYQQRYVKREEFIGGDVTAAIKEEKISRLVEPVRTLYNGVEPGYVIVVPKDTKLFMQRDPNYLDFVMQDRKVTAFNSRHEDFKNVAKKIVESPRMEVVELIKSVEDIKRIAEEHGPIMKGDIIEVQPRNIRSNLLEFFRKKRKREI